MKTPQRGDIIVLNLDPTSGREQKGQRSCVVISHTDFNKNLYMSYVVPITSKIRGNAFEVFIDTKKTKGVALTHQVKVVDLKSRAFQIVDKLNLGPLMEIISKIKNIID